VHKESVVNNLGNPTSKTDCSLNNEPKLILPRITAFSPRDLMQQKGMEWGRIVLILRSAIMDFRKDGRPVKVEANSMKIDQLPLFLRRTFQKKTSTQVVKPVAPTGESSVMQTLLTQWRKSNPAGKIGLSWDKNNPSNSARVNPTQTRRNP
jgi:hypothetical protein